MDYTQDIIRKNYLFFVFFFIFSVAGLGATVYFGRDELHLLTNKYYSTFFDNFFKYFSKIGPIIFVTAILIFILKKEKYKTLFILLSSYLINFSIVTAIKRGFFIHVHRPTFYFSQKGIDLHLIDGVTSQIPFTYPSGHTSEAFLLMLFVCLLTKSKSIHFIASYVAILMAFSRVYLSKHFLIDTIGGAFIGVFIMTFMYYFFQNRHSNFLDRKIMM